MPTVTISLVPALLAAVTFLVCRRRLRLRACLAAVFLGFALARTGLGGPVYAITGGVFGFISTYTS